MRLHKPLKLKPAPKKPVTRKRAVKPVLVDNSPTINNSPPGLRANFYSITFSKDEVRLYLADQAESEQVKYHTHVIIDMHTLVSLLQATASGLQSLNPPPSNPKRKKTNAKK